MRQLDNTETTQLWTHNKEPSSELPDYVFKICRVFFTSAFFNPWLIISRLKLDTSNSVMGVLLEKHWVKLKSNFRRSSGVFFKWQNFRIYEFLTSFSYLRLELFHCIWPKISNSLSLWKQNKRVKMCVKFWVGVVVIQREREGEKKEGVSSIKSAEFTFSVPYW